MKFYEIRTIEKGNRRRYFAIFKKQNNELVEVEIPEIVKITLDDLQREHWRLVKQDCRHVAHMEAIPEAFLPGDVFGPDPVDMLVQRLESAELVQAFRQLPLKQQRRFIMRHLLDLPIKKIAKIEGCSDRSIKYSLHLARKNLRDILES